MPDYLLAHDIGTTGNKATLFDAAGNLLASVFVSYPTHYPAPGGAEQEPEAWWRAVCACTKEIMAQYPKAASRVAAVGFSGMMNGCVLVDGAGQSVRPALIHADTRSAPQCARIALKIAPERVYTLSGNQLAPYFTLSKLAWLVENEPEALAAARWCVQAKEFVMGRMTGVWGITDPSDASLTGLLDMRSGAWSEELVAAGGFPKHLLPEIQPSATVVGQVGAEAAAQTGLLAGTPVVLGAGDGACATVGAGAVAPGDAYHYLGGTSWIASVAGKYVPDPKRRISQFCSMIPGQYVVYGTVQSAGSSLDWFLKAVGLGAPTADPYAALDALAAESPPGARGLLFLPYLQGERAPIWDSNARGVWFGLSSAHTRADLARSVYEGVALALGSILAVFEELHLAPASIRALGGGMRSDLWRKLFTAVYGRPLVVMERLAEATSCGAAVAAAVGVGLLSDGEAGRRFAPVARTEMPDVEGGRFYARLGEFYRALYPAMAERFAALQALTN